MSSLLHKGYRLFQDGEYYGLEHREDTRRIDAEIRDQWAFDPLLTAGLDYFYRGGVGWTGTLYTDVAAGSVALADDDVNYVEHTLAGVVSANTVGFSADKIPMAQVTTLDGVVTSVLDRRSEPFGALVLTSALGVANGVATLDGSGLVPTSQMPPLVISEVFTVASEAAMLALVAERGDVAIRTDTNETFILSTDSPGTLGDWKLIVFAASSGSVMFAADTRVLGRNAGGGAGPGEELTLSQILDFIGGAARGDLLVRGAATWGRLAIGAAGRVLASDGTDPAYVDPAAPLESLIVAVSDEATAITTGDGKVTFRMPYAFTLVGLPRANLNTASTSGAVTLDITEAGSTIFSTLLTIDQDEKTSTTAATPAVVSDTALADDAEMQVNIDGAGTGAKGLKVTLIGRRT